ncbi:MAG TPA: DnaJ domain-containing protein [Candidatus Limnocylindrales bacterium]|nr:DnaJ domain-containing protein [Candidatus Limnocylindrales bacterium]
MNGSELDPYRVLQVDPEAEDEVIQAAYRRLAQKYHPDRSPGPEGETRMVAINAAWDVLRDPARRAAYDRSRRSPGGVPGATEPAAADARTAEGRPNQPPETVSRDWTSGRSSVGGGYDASAMRAPEGYGAAGPPPGNPSGSVLNFGRFAGWSLGEIARTDLEYIEWLDRAQVARQYRDEIDAILRRTGRRRSADTEATERRGLFRRR